MSANRLSSQPASRPRRRRSERLRDRQVKDLVETSRTLRRTMFVHVAFSFFCVFTLLSRPDKELIAPGSTVQVPLPLVSQFEMSFMGFLVVGPLLVLAVTVYLHAFLRHLEELKEKRRVPADEAPYLFNLGHAPSALLSHLVFYWLTPAVLALFSWKALSLPIGPWLFLAFALAAAWCGSVWFLIRHLRQPKRRWKPAAVCLMAAALVLAALYPDYLRGFLRSRRGMNLYQADLSGQDLSDRLLTKADLREADLSGADLSGVRLARARLQGADLTSAQLVGADLRHADLSRARLAGADLAGADLTGADLSEAELAGAQNLLQREQLDATCHDIPPRSYPRGLLPPLPCDLREEGARPDSKQVLIGWAEDEKLNRRVFLEGGDFEMGTPDSEWGLRSERPAHPVALAPFYLQEHEVTRKEWARFHSEPSWAECQECKRCEREGVECKECEECEENLDLPVVDIPWHWAMAYAAWLGGSLPTEAQWEYAARAGWKGAWPFDEAQIGDYAWFDGNAEERLHPVARKIPNPLGLYDLYGNAWEWCRDWYGHYPEEPQVDPLGPDTGPGRVVRGGSFWQASGFLRSASREHSPPHTTGELGGDYGFRVAFPARAQDAPP